MLYKFYYNKSSNIKNTNCDIEWYTTEKEAKESLHLYANEYYKNKIKNENYPEHFFNKYKPEKDCKYYIFGESFSGV